MIRREKVYLVHPEILFPMCLHKDLDKILYINKSWDICATSNLCQLPNNNANILFL